MKVEPSGTSLPTHINIQKQTKVQIYQFLGKTCKVIQFAMLIQFTDSNRNILWHSYCFHVPNCKGESFSSFWKISPPISLYYDPSLIKNFYKATNPSALIKPIPFCAHDLTVRHSSVFFKLKPLPLIPVENK